MWWDFLVIELLGHGVRFLFCFKELHNKLTNAILFHISTPKKIPAIHFNYNYSLSGANYDALE